MTKRVIIVGGGISGLAAAHRVLELGGDPLLIEATDRLGGVIDSETRDGFLLEHGPDNFITNKPGGIDLAKQLGLEHELIHTSPDHRGALLVRNGRLHPVPEGFLMMAPTRLGPMITTPLLSWRGKLRMAAEMLIPARRENKDESLASFVRRRFGREALDRLVQPLISGIYTADPEKLSLAATMPQFLDMEQRHGSLISAMRAAGRSAHGSESGARYSLFVTFRAGMRTLVDALEQKIGAHRIRKQTAIDQIHPTPQGVTLRTTEGEMLEADAVILALPALHAAAIVRPFAPDLATDLAQLTYASSAVVNFAYDRSAVEHPLNAFGIVVPKIEKLDILAASFSSVKYAGRAPDGRPDPRLPRRRAEPHRAGST